MVCGRTAHRGHRRAHAAILPAMEAASAAEAPRVVLIGMMGSGKSTVGRALSARTGWPYVDNDELLLQIAGASPKEILAQRGEAELRASESAALMLGLRTPAPCIIGAAAGTILDEANRDAMRRSGRLVWLRANPETLAARSIGAPHRAWLDEGGQEWIHQTAELRDPLYASVAEVTLDVEGRSAEELAAEIERLVTRPAPGEPNAPRP